MFQFVCLTHNISKSVTNFELIYDYDHRSLKVQYVISGEMFLISPQSTTQFYTVILCLY